MGKSSTANSILVTCDVTFGVGVSLYIFSSLSLSSFFQLSIRCHGWCCYLFKENPRRKAQSTRSVWDAIEGVCVFVGVCSISKFVATFPSHIPSTSIDRAKSVCRWRWQNHNHRRDANDVFIDNRMVNAAGDRWYRISVHWENLFLSNTDRRNRQHPHRHTKANRSNTEYRENEKGKKKTKIRLKIFNTPVAHGSWYWRWLFSESK